MITFPAIVREAATRIGELAEESLEAFQSGRVKQEPQLTDRMLGRIEQGMHEFESKGVVWRAATLGDRGPGSPESRYKADFVGVLSIRLPAFTVDKGFLVQAKFAGANDKFSAQAVHDLKEQCRIMLQLSPDSFVFVYSQKNIRVIPAVSIVGAEFRGPGELYSRSVTRFFELHFESFIGDPSIHEPSLDALEALARRYESRNAIALQAIMPAEQEVVG